MKFYNILIAEGKEQQAAEFYISEFRGILKEVKRNFERKNNYFTNLLKNPSALKDRNVFEELQERFLFTFNKLLTNFLYNPMDLGNQSPSTLSSVIDENTTGSTNNINFDNVIINSNDTGPSTNLDAEPICNAEREIKDLSKLSTMEEYSDFEDDVENHLPCYLQDGASNDFPSAGPAGVSDIGAAFKRIIFLMS
jgi:hypothetical protein